MKAELYDELRKYVYESFETTHAGLNTLLKSDENFSNYVERQYRLQQYKQTGDFYMTSNEKWFHLIGFIDAIICFERGNLLKSSDLLKQELKETFFGDGEVLDNEDLTDYRHGLVSIDDTMALLEHCYMCFEGIED